MERDLARHQVCGLIARKWQQERPRTVSAEIDSLIELATDLYLNLANVLEAYNASPFDRPDLPLDLARTAEEARAIQAARVSITEFLRSGLTPLDIRNFLNDNQPEDNSPMLGGDRRQTK